LSIKQRVEEHPFVAMGMALFLGVVSTIGFYQQVADVFGFKVVREDDYIRREDVRREYMPLEHADDLRDENANLKDRIDRLELELSSMRSGATNKVTVARENSPRTKADTSRCRELEGDLASKRQEKNLLDAEIDRLIKNSASVTYSNGNGAPVVVNYGEREVNEKKRQSDNLNAEVVSLLELRNICGA
jgi:hypothetical protein